jgi:hypothetical protein
MDIMITPASPAHAPEPVTAMERYLFDLRGFLVLKNVITADHVAGLNTILDRMLYLTPPLAKGEWYGNVHTQSFGSTDGVNFQQIYEGGEPFERLIDNPTWIEKVKYFVGGARNFDNNHGPLFIDENFANIRRKGEAIGLHSGGETPVKRCQFRYRNGEFSCGQINILMALTDIGPGDGATMVIPGSHKANFRHPRFDDAKIKSDEASSLDNVEGAVEVHLQKGDAILFVDAISHGSAARVNEGERRIVVYRYGPSWGNFRWPYQVSASLLERLTPAQRQIVQPQAPVKREPNRLPGTPSPLNARSA